MVAERDTTMPKARQASQFPFWGAIAVPAGVLWGVALGLGAGMLFGNLRIGAAIGAALGCSIGLCVFAAAVVVASSRA